MDAVLLKHQLYQLSNLTLLQPESQVKLSEVIHSIQLIQDI
jgi:hypothetical protein